jgi:DNA-binding CsgD family transcriptional regulator
VARHRGAYQRGRAFATEALAIQRQLGDLRGAGYSLNNLGIMAQASGEPDQAADLYAEALRLFRTAGDKRGISVVLPGLSDLAYRRGALEEARALAEEALHLHRELGETRAIAQRLDALARLARLTGDPERAMALRRESLRLFVNIGDQRGVAMALDGLASLLAATDPTRAAELFGRATTIRDTIHAAPDYGAYVDAAAHDAVLAELRARLGQAGFARAWDRGRLRAFEQNLSHAFPKERVRPRGRLRTPSPGPTVGPLTSREREVVRLVAQARTNREIGAALRISPGTARTHVEHVLAKLGLRSRVEVAAWAVREGLTGTP